MQWCARDDLRGGHICSADQAEANFRDSLILGRNHCREALIRGPAESSAAWGAGKELTGGGVHNG